MTHPQPWLSTMMGRVKQDIYVCVCVYVYMYICIYIYIAPQCLTALVDGG